jgi:DNA-binding FrmR family transcriptional regulator
MLEAGRSCIEIATQMQAVENAIGQAKRVLIQGHLGDCLDHALSPLTPEQRLSLREIKEITRYL